MALLEAARRFRIDAEDREFHDAFHAGLPGRIDESALKIGKVRSRGRVYERDVNSGEGSFERFGVGHVALDDLDAGESDVAGPGGVARQRAELHATTGKRTNDIGAAGARAAGDEDHGNLLQRESIASNDRPGMRGAVRLEFRL